MSGTGTETGTGVRVSDAREARDTTRDPLSIRGLWEERAMGGVDWRWRLLERDVHQLAYVV